MRLSKLLLVLLPFYITSQAQVHDLVLRGGLVFDGSGAEPVRQDIAIKSGQIVDVAANISDTSLEIIELDGLAISPGFIDMHAHIEPLALYPDAKSHLMQGVTTTLGGPDGSSAFPLGPYLDSLSENGLGVNVAYLIGHNTIRNHVMGLVDRTPTSDELQMMRQHVEDAMHDGAYGISTGLKYLPGTFAETTEIISLAKSAARLGGIYTSHLREEGLGLLESVAEAITIAEEAQIPVVLTHHKAIGEPMWGASKKTLLMVDEARASGLDVMIDQYPYTASHTWLGVIIPPWSLEGHAYREFAVRCQDPLLRDSIKKGIIHNMVNDRGGNDLRRIQFAKIAWKPEFAGKTLHDLVIAEGMEPTIENGAEMVIQIQLHQGANCIYHVMAEEDVDRIMQHPQTMIASDGRTTVFGQGHPHPRAYGTFPRVLGRYVREKEILTLPEAIHKMTGLPAARLGLTDRGLIRKGFWADLVVFDPKTIIDKATFQKPHAYPEGIIHVLVNGNFAVKLGHFDDVRAGQILRKLQH